MLKKILSRAPYRIFVAMFIIVIIAFSACYIILRNSTNAIYNQTKQNAKLTAKSMVKSFDESFKEVNNTIYTVNLLHYQVYDEGGYKGLNMSNIVQLFNDARQMISQDYVYDFVIHFSESRLAVTSQGTTDFDDFFNNELKNIVYTADFWNKFANVKHAMKIIPSADYTKTTLDNNTYTRDLIGVVGNNKMNNTKMNILIFLDVKSLLERVNQQNMVEGSSLIVLDQDRNIILNTDKNFDKNILDSIYFGKAAEKSIQDKENDYYCIKSEYNDFIYISKIPFITKKMVPEMTTNLIVMIAAFVLTAGACVLLGFYLYAPVRKMFVLLKTGSNDKLPDSYDDACSELELLYTENRFYRSRMEAVKDDVRRSIFFKMIDGATSHRKLKDGIDVYFKDILSCSNFFMLAFQFDPEYSKKDKNTVLSVILATDFENEIQRQLSLVFDFPVVFYAENSSFLALAGLRNGKDRKYVTENVGKIIDELKQNNSSGYVITGAISRLYTDADDFKTAYKEIKACIAYRKVKSESIVIDFEKLNSVNSIYLPGDYIEKLSNYIASGNSRESKAIIEQIVTENLENDISYIKFGNVISSIFNNIINTLEIENYEEEKIEKLEMEFFRKINNNWNHHDLQQFLNSIIDRITADLGNRRQGKLNREFVLEYINLHYAEDLHLENMAGMTETSPKYFSNFFKKAIGTNFVEYLNKVRIQHAKEFLKNTEILVSDIGEKVGYANSSTFTSTFKKYCGISPVEYRKDFK